MSEITLTTGGLFVRPPVEPESLLRIARPGQEPAFQGDAQQPGAVGHAEFLHEPAAVGLHSLDTQRQPVSRRLISMTGGDQTQYLFLAVAECLAETFVAAADLERSVAPGCPPELH